MEPAARLPGVYFRSEVPQPDDALPRMDVAAFVGFATGGPLGLPVAVEDIGRYREIFGADPELAWDAERSRGQGGYLGPAVEAFFRNGGRRCWVVRVGAESAHTHTFRLPGLQEAASAAPAVAPARSAGSWADDLKIGTVLNRATLLVGRAADGSEPPLQRVGDLWRLYVTAAPAGIGEGDLVELSFDGRQAIAYLFLDEVESTESGLLLTGSQALWFQPPAASPPGADVDAVGLEAITEAAGLAFYQSWAAASPVGSLAARLLTFDLLAFHGEQLEHRLGGLAFSHSKPRFWGNLPSDRSLFRLPQGRLAPPRTAEVDALRQEANNPRFPLAGAPVADDQTPPLYLPVGMTSRPSVGSAVGPQSGAPTSALERNGLTNFSADLFLDDDLAGTGGLALLRQAESKYYLRQQPLDGLYALLPVDEVTLVAVPDAVQRGWNQNLPRPEGTLGAPELDPIPGPDAFGRYRISWSEVAGASDYVLQRNLAEVTVKDVPTTLETIQEVESWALRNIPGLEAIDLAELDAATAREVVAAAGCRTFLDPVTAYSGAEAGARIALPGDCPERHAFRVRALRHGEVGPWSRARIRELPPSDFARCDQGEPPDLVLVWRPGSPQGELAWWVEDGSPLGDPPPSASPPLGGPVFEVQKASDLDFVSAETIILGVGDAYPQSRPFDAPVFFRVRALGGQTPGPWSNTERLDPATRNAQTLVASDDYEHGDLVAVQRALLRFCAARADLIAVLSLPRHYRREEVLNHLGALLPVDDPEAESTPLGSGEIRVRPLTVGEGDALDYGALYHGWTAAAVEPRLPTEDEQLEVGFTPPDGAVAGLMARLALDEGAWYAPANLPLAAVVAVDPVIPRTDWAVLAEAQVNGLWRDPRGFVLLGADTLSGERERRPLNVRRLLILLRRLALREGVTEVFEPNDADFRSFTRHRFERFLSDLYLRGAFAGRSPEAAFRVVTDESLNPRQSLDLGRFIVELQVAPSRPLAFLTVRLVQSGPEQLVVEEV